MPDLNSVHDQVKAIIDYNWEKESEDFANMLAEGEDTENHVFRSLMAVSNVLDGTDTGPEEWARKQFHHELFEDEEG